MCTIQTPVVLTQMDAGTVLILRAPCLINPRGTSVALRALRDGEQVGSA